MSRPITSCITCRTRKVRCNRQRPTCAACSKGPYDCVYSERPASSANRIHKNASHGTSQTKDLDVKSRVERLEALLTRAMDGKPLDVIAAEAAMGNVDMQEEKEKEKEEEIGPMVKPAGDGALVMKNGSTRFVTPAYWALLGEEIHEIKHLLSDDREEATDGITPLSPTSFPEPLNPGLASNNSFLFGRLDNSDLSRFYPDSPEELHTLFKDFLRRVNPIHHMFHVPTLTSRFNAFASALFGGRDLVSANLITFEPLAFAILFSATFSHVHQDPLVANPQRVALLGKYREGFEASLVKVDFLTSAKLEVLQAFVLFLTVLCREEDSTRIYPLVGIAIRMAQVLGLQRDPSSFKLDPPMDEVIAESRRRLWFQVLILDMRTSEGQGQNLTITEESYNTKLPRNVDDCDLIPGRPFDPNLVDPGKHTEMTPQLVRLRGTISLCRVLSLSYGLARQKSNLAEEKKLAKRIHDEIIGTLDVIRKEYLEVCNEKDPMQLFTIGLTMILEWRCWIMYYHQFSSKSREAFMDINMRKSIYTKSLLSIDTLSMSNHHPEMSCFAWYFDSHSVFHACIHILSEIRSPSFCGTLEFDFLRERGLQVLEIMLSKRRGSRSKPFVVIQKMMKAAKAACASNGIYGPGSTRSIETGSGNTEWLKGGWDGASGFVGGMLALNSKIRDMIITGRHISGEPLTPPPVEDSSPFSTNLSQDHYNYGYAESSATPNNSFGTAPTPPHGSSEGSLTAEGGTGERGWEAGMGQDPNDVMDFDWEAWDSDITKFEDLLRADDAMATIF